MSVGELTPRNSVLADFGSAAALRHRRWRHFKDIAMRYLMAFGGIAVIATIVVIAFYLVYVVLPLFVPARVEPTAEYALPGDVGSETLYLAMEEQREVGLRLTGDGSAVFFRTANGEILNTQQVVSPEFAIVSFAAGDLAQHLFAYGLADGRALLARHAYTVTYPNDVRLITPALEFPFGSEPIQVDAAGRPLQHISAQYDGDVATIAAVVDDSRVLLLSLEAKRSLLSKEAELVRTESAISVQGRITHLRLDVEQRELYAADTAGFIHYYDVSDKAAPRLVQRVTAVPDGVRITSLEFLSGGISILVGDTRGTVTQWFPVRDEENNYTVQMVRSFSDQTAPIVAIAPEYFRKGFLATDESGTVGLYHSTAHRTLAVEKLAPTRITQIAVAPRANASLLQSGDATLRFIEVHNEHPEVSWQSIWGKVWYESRQQAEYIWQSSSASSDFEPKFSLTPLSVGTIKASLYAMLFSLPLSILGAMYTAYFMSPRMRNMVKPTIEIMAALPTVILGFLAGLWLAPFVERNMPGFFAVLILTPPAILLAAWLWEFVPAKFRNAIGDGWEAALLVPVIIGAGVVSFALSQPLEILLFDGNMPLWITNELGLEYSQRNSLVVGVAMGFAVIPIIFSISEDAIYSVPKHLTTGSLALGATTWQTMVRVVLLTASPGIFSAVMIGLGRAVGETMIVVMATGNTAVMDFNIFQGFRALSANIAVEMPESEVGGSHYRILFLAALVLFIATFVFNTAAELVRQRLRVKYSNL
jgi:phosphate transport system permease protein